MTNAVSDASAACPSWIVPGHGPPAWISADHAWSFTRYADAAAVLKNPTLRVVDAHAEIERLARLSGRDYSNLTILLGGHLFFRNPPFHRKARSFLKDSVTLLDLMSGQTIGAVVEPLVAAARTQGRVEAMSFLCNRVPVQVMARAFGLTEAAVADMIAAAKKTAGATLHGVPLRTLDALEHAAAQVVGSMREAIGEARRTQSTGFGRMIELNDASYGFEDGDLVGLAFFLILASIETTSSTLGSTIHFLVSDPVARQRVLDQPHSVRACVDESLRMVPPLRRSVARVAPEGLVICGVDCEPGVLLIADIEQAGYDPAAYRNPGRFDPARFEADRADPPVLGFSAGPHTCLGAALARLEVGVVIRTLFGQHRCTLVQECPDWDDQSLLRRLKTLEIVVE